MVGEGKRSLTGGIYLIALYCLPVMAAILILMYDYFERVDDAAEFIETKKVLVGKAYDELVSEKPGEMTAEQWEAYISENLVQHKSIKALLDNNEVSDSTKKLVNYYVWAYLSGAQDERDIIKEARRIWLVNAPIISLMALLPFLLLSSRLASSRLLPLNQEERKEVAACSWGMKFIVAFIVTYGWMYVLNPHGRGADTVSQFVIAVDLSQPDTLPIFLYSMISTPVIAGFLGWYLYSLTYFFSKMLSNDVVSAQVYGVMFQKFLFTYGIALLLPVQSGGQPVIEGTGIDDVKLMAFLIGYFPMSVFSLIKDAGMKVVQGVQPEKGQLNELPGISRWQILRLEEEGIDSMGALAYRNHDNLRTYLPAMAGLVDYWEDIARLYVVVGQEEYQALKSHCRSASEFIRQAGDAQFVATVTAAGIGNPAEIARLLKRTFPSLDHQ